MSFLYYATKAVTKPLNSRQFAKILEKERITYEQWVGLSPKLIADACIKDPNALRNWAEFFINHVGRHYHSPVFYEFAAEFQDLELNANAMMDFILGNLGEKRVQQYLRRTLMSFFEKRKVNGHPRDLNYIWPMLSVFAKHGPAPEQLFPKVIHRHDTSQTLRMVVTPHVNHSIEELIQRYRY